MESNHETRTPEQGIEFLRSMRGMYIMAQALQVAIATMKAVEPEYHIEHSNIDDMEFLQETLFNFPVFDVISESIKPPPSKGKPMTTSGDIELNN